MVLLVFCFDVVVVNYKTSKEGSCFGVLILLIIREILGRFQYVLTKNRLNPGGE